VVAQRGQRGLDGIGGTNAQSELGGEVIEGEQLVAVLSESDGGSWILGWVLLFKELYSILELQPSRSDAGRSWPWRGWCAASS
jgi:hypothetical protein